MGEVMISEENLKKLYINGCDIKKNEPLKYYTSFRIGGSVPLALFPKTLKTFSETLFKLKEYNIPYKILGQGTNLIVSDSDLKFNVLSTKYLNNLKIEKKDNQSLVIEVESGMSLSAISFLVSGWGYSGLEFACGIPGTVGGGIYMNAGAYGGEMKEVVLEVESYDLKNNKIRTLKKEDMKFGYRKSIFQEGNLVILSAKILLEKDNQEFIYNKIKDYSTRRWEKQPIDMPSAGSIFKRPKPDFYVGTTIEKLGLKGYAIGDAQISTKHAGFIINRGNASFEDVISLIEHVKRVVKENYGVSLEVEPQIWR